MPTSPRMATITAAAGVNFMGWRSEPGVSALNHTWCVQAKTQEFPLAPGECGV